MPPAPSPSALRILRALAFEFESTTTRTPSRSLLRCTYQPTTLPTPYHHITKRTYTYTTPRYTPPPQPNTVNPYAPRTSNRGPVSTETTQTDFSKMDIMSTSNVAIPATSIDACTTTGFHLNNETHTDNWDGLLLLGGEAFIWSPHKSPSKFSLPDGGGREAMSNTILDARGIFSIPQETLGLLATLSPKPDLLLIGTGSKLWMLAKHTRDYINRELGIRVDVMDTANAASSYNLLAQERGVDGGSSVGAALLPLGWKGR